MSAPVIVVETDAAAASYLVEQLGADGYEARVARGASHAAALARQCAPELVLLGELDGRREALELLVAIRAGVGDGEPFDPGCAVLVLAQRAGELDLLRAFEAGADDVVRRSCGYVELRARARALLRRAGGGARRRLLRVGPLEVDVTARLARVDGAPVGLREREFQLLARLAGDPERVFTRHELLRDVWGYHAPATTRTLDSHACRLRRKLGGASRVAGVERRWVVNVWGVGYRLR